MLGFADVAAYTTTGDVYIAVLCTGLYGVLYRLLLTSYFIRRYHIEALKEEDVPNFWTTIKEKWGS